MNNALAQLMALAGNDHGNEAQAFAGICADCGRKMYNRRRDVTRPEGWVAKASASKCFTCHRKNPVRRVLKPNCDVCRLPMRARNDPKIPGTRMRYADGLCDPCKKRSEHVPRARPRTEDAAHSEIVRLRRETELSRAEIGLRVGRSLATVGRVLAASGLVAVS